MFFSERLFKRKQPEASAEAEEEFLDETFDADNSLFLRSLEEITPEEIAPDAAVKQPAVGDRIYEGVRLLLMFVCAVVFVGCLALLIQNQIESAAANDFYTDLAGQIFVSEADLPSIGINRMTKPASDPLLPVFADAQLVEENINSAGMTPVKTYNLEFERMKAFLTDLKAENPDIYGYIRIDGTTISYPIVQYTDNDHYLDYQSNGKPSVSGSIFADYRCEKTLLDNSNLILYGHNMTNGTMFNNVTKFFDVQFFLNTQIVIYTFDGIYTYEPFAIFSTNSRFDYARTYFPEKQTMIDFCNTMQAKSTIKCDLTFTSDEKLLTLSTCTNIGDGRYALHARLVKVEN